MLEKNIYSKINLSSRIAIVIPEIKKMDSERTILKTGQSQIGYSYDVDSKILKLCASGAVIDIPRFGYSVESVATSTVSSRNYVGQNSYGAKVTVSSISGENINVAVQTFNEDHCSIKLDIDSISVQSLLKSSGVVLFGRLGDPYVSASAIHEKASITSPIEMKIAISRLLFIPDRVVLLNRDSRKIIQAADW